MYEETDLKDSSKIFPTSSGGIKQDEFPKRTILIQILK
jgi:hypothetical protein